MPEKVRVAGVGMIPFSRPGRSGSYPDMAERAARAALDDAGIPYAAVQQAYAGYVYGDSTAGQRALYSLGLSGIPVVNVNNNCATGSSALWLARQAVASGAADCVLAVGFEQMRPGALGRIWDDRPDPLDRFLDRMTRLQGFDDRVPVAAQLFGGAGSAYTDAYGTSPATFAKIAVKARRHAAGNPYAVFRTPITEDEVLASPHVYGPLTRLQCCPPTCGAAAAVLCSRDFARRHGVRSPVVIRAQAMTSDTPTSFAASGSTDMMRLVGYDMTREAARQVYEAGGCGPEDIEVVELHDCFTANELITYEALGLTPEGTGEKFVLDGDKGHDPDTPETRHGMILSCRAPRPVTRSAQCRWW